MTVASSPGIPLAVAIQSAKGTPETSDENFHRFRAVQAQIGPIQATGQFPQQVGGGYHAPGMYKRYVAAGGSATMLMPLAGDFGYILWGLLGAPQATGASLDGDSETIFETTFKPVDPCDHPWISARRLIPNCDTDDVHGEYINDGKITGMSVQVAPSSPAQVQLGFLGRESGFLEYADVSDWATGMPAYENNDSAVVGNVTGMGAILSAVSGVDLGGTGGAGSAFTVPTIGMQMSVNTQFSGSQVENELVIGSLSIDDLVPLRQDIGITLTYKWKDPKLYKAIYALSGETVGNTPTSEILKTGVSLTLNSPQILEAATPKYESLEISLTECSISCPQPPVLTGGSFVTLQIQIAAEQQATPQDFASFKLINGTNYAGVTYS